jgi:hypothetical protein
MPPTEQRARVRRAAASASLRLVGGSGMKRRSFPADPERSMSSTSATLTRGRSTPSLAMAVTSSRERAVRVEWCRCPYRDVGAHGRLAYLVLAYSRSTAECRAGQVQMDLDVAVVDERALGASLDVCDAATGPRVGVRLGQHGQFIGELVANQRSRVIDDVGDEKASRRWCPQPRGACRRSPARRPRCPR